MRHYLDNGFHTSVPVALITVENTVLVERHIRSRKPTGHVIVCADRATADHVETELFFNGADKEVFFQPVSGSSFQSMTR